MQLNHVLFLLLCAPAVTTLTACAPNADAGAGTDANANTGGGMKDLTDWLTATRQEVVDHRKIAISTPGDNGQDNDAGNRVTITSARLAAVRDPFEPFTRIASAVTASDAVTQQVGDAVIALRLLGIIDDQGTAYALIEADKQILCVAAHDALPSYPITVAAINGQTVEIDRLLPDGSHRNSTLRLGQ